MGKVGQAQNVCRPVELAQGKEPSRHPVLRVEVLVAVEANDVMAETGRHQAGGPFQVEPLIPWAIFGLIPALRRIAALTSEADPSGSPQTVLELRIDRTDTGRRIRRFAIGRPDPGGGIRSLRSRSWRPGSVPEAVRIRLVRPKPGSGRSPKRPFAFHLENPLPPKRGAIHRTHDIGLVGKAVAQVADQSAARAEPGRGQNHLIHKGAFHPVKGRRLMSLVDDAHRCQQDPGPKVGSWINEKVQKRLFPAPTRRWERPPR